MNNRSTPALALALIALLLLALAPGGGTHVHAQGHGHADTAKGKKKGVRYVCPMHADVVSDKPGKCPECGMNLKAEAKGKAGEKPEAPAQPTQSGAGTAAPEALKIPDVAVLDQDGRELKFYTDLVKGKTVAVQFVFTTCTTVCPPLGATFARVQKDLGGRAGRDVHLISISVDPATDTPERMKAWGAKFKAGAGWTLVTGGVPEINALLRALGAGVSDKNDHTPTVLVGNDAAGHWTRTYGLASASTLVKVIDEAAAKGAGASQASAPAPAATAVEKPAAGMEKSAASAYFPNHVLVTQEGKPVRFYDDLLKGKVVLINFMFTTCAGVCPPMAANLAKVQSYLGDRVGKDVVMISISVDPEVDTPQKLKEYAGKFKAGPGWYFLTGKKENVDWVLYKVGGYVEDKSQHSGVLVIGNEATGEWMKTAALRNPAQIAEAVLGLLKTGKN